MTQFTRLDEIRKHLGLEPRVEPRAPEPAIKPARAEAPVRSADTGKRVQKNLTILETDAARLKALADRNGVSQARLLSEALDAYECNKHGR